MAGLDLVLVGKADEVIEMLRRLDSCFEASSMAEFLGVTVAPWLRERSKSRFAGEGDDAVGAWSPLASSTVSIREYGIARGEWSGISGSHPINQRTHDMERYITGATGEVSANIGSHALHFPERTISSARGMDKKVKRAQLGDSRTPKRPVLGVAEKDLNFTLQQLAFFIERKVSS